MVQLLLPLRPRQPRSFLTLAPSIGLKQNDSHTTPPITTLFTHTIPFTPLVPTHNTPPTTPHRSVYPHQTIYTLGTIPQQNNQQPTQISLPTQKQIHPYKQNTNHHETRSAALLTPEHTPA
jgi:hypothetical protein